jgi:tetratricopeptide (TPR) repeat protein
MGRYGEELARDGHVDGAIAKFVEARALDASLELDPQTRAKELAASALIDQGAQLARDEDYNAALTAYREAIKIAPYYPFAYNSLCWWGSLSGQATEAEVIDACEQAVALAPEHGGIRDSRGVNRAFRGDAEGAIADFEAYVVWAPENGPMKPL